jgi:hypothetical protein
MRVGNDEFSPVRPHSENGFLERLQGTFPRTHRPYDYNEVFSR